MKYAFIPLFQTKVLRLSLIGLSSITEPINVVRGRNVLMDSASAMRSKPEAGGADVKFVRFHNFFPMPRTIGKGKGKINMGEATSVYTAHSFHSIVHYHIFPTLGLR